MAQQGGYTATGTSTTDDSGHGTISRTGRDDILWGEGCDGFAGYRAGDALRMSSALTDDYGTWPLSTPRSPRSILPAYFIVMEVPLCSVAVTTGRRVTTRKSCARDSESTLGALAFRRAFSLRCSTPISARTRLKTLPQQGLHYSRAMPRRLVGLRLDRTGFCDDEIIFAAAWRLRFLSEFSRTG